MVTDDAGNFQPAARSETADMAVTGTAGVTPKRTSERELRPEPLPADGSSAGTVGDDRLEPAIDPARPASAIDAVLVIPNPATWEHAAELRSRMLEAIASGMGIALDLSRVTRVDAAFLQLLVSLRRTAARQRVRLTLTAELPGPEVLQLAALAGWAETPGHWLGIPIEPRLSR